MASRKIDPFAFDNDTAPLSDEEVSSLRPGSDVLAELGLEVPRPRGRPKAQNPKRQITLRLDSEIVDHFKARGKGWQTQINEILRTSIDRNQESKSTVKSK